MSTSFLVVDYSNGATVQQPMTFIYKRDDNIILTIISLLDTPTLISLLNAFPLLQQFTLLITDHGMPPLYFGGLPDVQRRTLEPFTKLPENICPWSLSEDIVDISSPIFNRDTDRHPIKLVEITRERSCESFLPGVQDFSEPYVGEAYEYHRAIFEFDSLCFVFLGAPRFDLDQSSIYCRFNELANELDQFTRCKYHFGFRTYYTDYSEDSIHSPRATKHVYHLSSRNSPEFQDVFLAPGPVIWGQRGMHQSNDYWESLTTLRIENMPHLMGVYFPQLLELAVILSDPGHGKRSYVTGVHAPHLRSFTVHYKGSLPLFDSCEVGTEELAGSFQPWYNVKSFELAHYWSLEHSQFAPNSNAMDTSDECLHLSFLLNGFKNLVLGAGVPISAIDPFHLKHIVCFHWNVSSAECAKVREPDGIIKMPSLQVSVIRITGPSVKLPAIQMPDLKDQTFSKVHLSSLAFDASISKYWRSLALCKPFHCDLYSSPRLLHHMWGPDRLNRIISLTVEDWSVSIPGIAKSHLTLTGFEVGFLSKASVDKLKPACPISLWTNKWGSRVIQPVINIETQGGTAMVDISWFKVADDKGFWVKLLPPFLVSEQRTWKATEADTVEAHLSAEFDIPALVREGTNYTVIDLYPCYTKSFFNRLELTRTPDQDWINQVASVSHRKYGPSTILDRHRWQMTRINLDQYVEGKELKFQETYTWNYSPRVSFPDVPSKIFVGDFPVIVRRLLRKSRGKPPSYQESLNSR